MLLQAINNAANVLEAVGELDNAPLTDSFKETVKKYIQENNVDEKVLINLDNTKRSIRMSNYFLAHKKFLSGYTPSGVVDQSVNMTSQLSRKIALYPGNIVPCNAITKSTRYTAEQVKEEMRQMAELGLGETKHEKPVGGGRLIYIFYKKELCALSLEQTVDITSKLSKVGIELKEYEHSLANTENAPPCKKAKLADNSQTSQSLRV